MIVLVAGVALWIGAHSLRRIAPDLRARLGDEKGRGMIALAVLLSIILMIFGYRMADGPVWWGPSPATTGINNLLVLIGFYLFAASGMKTRVGRAVRHPQLIGFSFWAVAHLLVNGDLPSFILFGGLLLWALWEIAGNTNPAPEGEAPAITKDVIAFVAGAILFAVVAMIHWWLGYYPFGG